MKNVVNDSDSYMKQVFVPLYSYKTAGHKQKNSIAQILNTLSALFLANLRS
jgi:hypothetical protein